MAPGNVVHVIDDDEAMRQSLDFLLKTVGFEVRTYESATAFLSMLEDAAPGCIITDVSMPGMSGVELLRRLRELGRNMPAIVITGHGEVQLAVEAMKIGAKDFIEKPFDDDVLLAAIGSALDTGQTHAERDATMQLEKLARLSSRERDVLEGLVVGKPNRIIAFDLGISPRTVEIYRANVMTKMGAGSLADLVRMALLAGLLKSPD